MEWCHSSSGWIFRPQLRLPGNPLNHAKNVSPRGLWARSSWQPPLQTPVPVFMLDVFHLRQSCKVTPKSLGNLARRLRSCSRGTQHLGSLSVSTAWSLSSPFCSPLNVSNTLCCWGCLDDTYISMFPEKGHMYAKDFTKLINQTDWNCCTYGELGCYKARDKAILGC